MNHHTDWLNNICWLTDSDKDSHFRQYPPGTRRVYSYFESRSGSTFPEVCFFGLRYFLKRYLACEVVTSEKIDGAESLFRQHFGRDVFYRAGWQHILDKHGGRLACLSHPVVRRFQRDSSSHVGGLVT